MSTVSGDPVTNYRDILKPDVSLCSILRRILSELNLQVFEHGDRVAYLYLELAQYRRMGHVLA